MQRSKFNDPQPGNTAELSQALGEKGMPAAGVVAEIHKPSPKSVGTRFEGWSADVFVKGGKPWEPAEKTFETVGFASKDAIVGALNAAGVSDLRFM